MNANFDNLCSEIEEIMEAEALLQTVRISGNRKFQEPWLTMGIETANRQKTCIIQNDFQKRLFTR